MLFIAIGVTWFSTSLEPPDVLFSYLDILDFFPFPKIAY